MHVFLTRNFFSGLSICTVVFLLTYYITFFYPSDSDSAFVSIVNPLIKPLTAGAKTVYVTNSTTSLRNGTLCPKLPSTLLGLVNVSVMPARDEELIYRNPHVLPGGRFAPNDCQATKNVAVIVPFRNRSKHLWIFLANIHPFLQRQKLSYAVFVVEQYGERLFNRGKLMNIGFTEASKSDDFDCFVFHDVEMVPENDHNLYSCSAVPSLLAVSSSSSNYKPMYWNYFGGVISMTKEQFIAVNGYGNLYWGRGSEDDDLSERVRHRFGTVIRRHREIGRYTKLEHEKDSLNPNNDLAYYLAKTALSRAAEDGLSNLYYQIIRLEKRPLYTCILVEIGRPPKLVQLPNGTLGFLEI